MSTDNDIVLIKLVTGETLMGVITFEQGYKIWVSKPILIKTVQYQVSGGIVDQTVIGEYCKFSLDESFEFNLNHVIHCSKLHPKMIEYYNRVVKQFYDVEDEYEEDLEDHEDVDVKDSIKKFH